MSLPYAWRDVRERLQQRVHDLLPALGVHAREAMGMVTPLNPPRADRTPGSFVIYTRGDRAGGWVDYATQEKGDVIDLIVYLRGLAGRLDGYWWALEFLGLGRGDVKAAPEREAERRRRERERVAAEARAQAQAADKARKMAKRWFGYAPIAGTLAWRYLTEARGLPIERLPKIPGALRFADDLQHIDQDTGEVTSWPAMVSAMTKGREITSLHRTWLQPDGLGKAPVAKAKKMLGPARGAAIRLTAGAAGVAPTHAKALERPCPFLLGEGIETVLTTAIVRPTWRAWAGGSLDNMALIDWPECCNAMVLLRENDEGKQAQAAFAKVQDHFWRQSAGRPFEVAASAVGSDFNDWVKAA